MSSWPFSVCAWLEEHAGDVALTGKQREARYYPLSTYDPTSLDCEEAAAELLHVPYAGPPRN